MDCVYSLLFQRSKAQSGQMLSNGFFCAMTRLFEKQIGQFSIGQIALFNFATVNDLLRSRLDFCPPTHSQGLYR